MKRLVFLSFLLLSLGFSATMTVPAVNSNMVGVLVDLSCEIIPGQGRTLVTTDPYIGIGAQESERLAREVVSNIVGELPNKDVIFIFSAEHTDTIDGGSAGMAMSICLLSEIENKSLGKGISITGSIDTEGAIVHVSGILQKARAVSSFATVFLIPEGQSKTLTYTLEYVNPSDGIYIEEVVPVEIDIITYAKDTWNLTVIEVRNITEAYDWMTRDIPLRSSVEFLIPEFSELPRMSALAEKSIERAESLIDEDVITSTAKDFLEKAKNISEDFPYSRANYAFLSAVASQTSYEDVEPITNEMLKQLEKFETSDPYWRAETELRLSWTLFRENTLVAKKDWLLIAANMFSLERIGNDTIKMNDVKKLANIKLLEAKTSVEENKILSGDASNAEESLNLAIKSLESELYFAALYNSLDAIAWSEASKGVSSEYITQVFTTEKVNDFAEAYRRHAIYLFIESETDSALFDAAVFSAKRADLRDDIFENMNKLPINFKFPELDWRNVLILVMGIYFFRSIRTKSKKKSRVLSEDDLIMLAEAKGKAVKLLQDKLKRKKISQETYVKLVRELEGL